MTTISQSVSRASSGLTAIFVTAFLGLAILFVAGHAQSASLHEAAHDARHSTGFPCH